MRAPGGLKTTGGHPGRKLWKAARKDKIGHFSDKNLARGNTRETAAGSQRPKRGLLAGSVRAKEGVWGTRPVRLGGSQKDKIEQFLEK